MNMSTPTTDGPETLRAPDRTETAERTTTFVWDLGPDPEGGTRQAVLNVSHQTGGRGGRFAATLLNRSEDGHEQRMGSITDWWRIKDEPVARYSQAAHERFAASALERLQTIHGQQDLEGEQVRGYFQLNS